jgi:hypothetical protein
MTQIQQSQHPILWFHLIGFNGLCWQSFGPIGAYNSFSPDDIYFFATELKPGIEEEAEILQDIENNPIPYMMLLSGANYPLTFHKEDQILFVMSEYDLDSLNTPELRNSFKTEYSKGVYRFTPGKWGEHPHLAQAYFDEKLKIIMFSAMTDRGFRELVRKINNHGHHFSEIPLFRVNTSMYVTAKDILKKEMVLNEYEDLFHVESSEETKKAVDDLNAFVALVLPDINAGRKPDIEASAKKAGVDIETARDVVKMIMGKTKQ